MDRPKLSLAALQELLWEAERQVVIDGRYAHYKHPEEPYAVEGLHIDEATQEVQVRYSPEANRAVTFARPLSVWVETVKHDGETVPRFRLIV